jgi:hypothetical protein
MLLFETANDRKRVLLGLGQSYGLNWTRFVFLGRIHRLLIEPHILKFNLNLPYLTGVRLVKRFEHFLKHF